MKGIEKSELDRGLEIVLRTGKVEWGRKKAKQAVERGNVELIVVARNIPEDQKEELEYYARLSGVRLVEYPGTSWDLGEVCGRPHMISAVLIKDIGDSKLRELSEREEEMGGEERSGKGTGNVIRRGGG